MQNSLDMTALSGVPVGHLNDGLPSYRDQIGSVKLSAGEDPVYLQRIPDGSGGEVWRISNATVALIPRMWDAHGFSDITIWLPDTLPRFAFVGMRNWQVAILAVGTVILWFVAGLICRLAMRLTLYIPNGFPEDIRRFWVVPMRVLVYVLLFGRMVGNLGSLGCRSRLPRVFST